MANVWSNLFLFNLFKDVFDLFHKISFLGSFIDRHFSVHLDVEVMVELLPKHDSFFYQLPMSMYLHLSRSFICSILLSPSQKICLSITNTVQCPSVAKNKRAGYSLKKKLNRGSKIANCQAVFVSYVLLWIC